MAFLQSRPQRSGLQTVVSARRHCVQEEHPTIDSLKHSLVSAVADFPIETMRAAIYEWTERLRACVQTKGGHFEN